jgi:5-formyltetrahydrofolate cyclo-ligase
VKRGTVTPEQRSAAGEAARQLFITNPLFDTSESIACYFSQDDEFDCTPLIQEIWRCGKKCYLPVLSSERKKELEFIAYRPRDPLRLNRYKIFEPEKGARVTAKELQLVIVPLVAFDEYGHRVGMGGGYYDCTFAFKRERKASMPYLLGLGYELQKTSALPAHVWDVLLDGVLTEKKVYAMAL